MISRLAAAMVLMSFSASAQQAATLGTGTVMGHVLCNDTQRPAHYASVMLIPKDSNKGQAEANVTSVETRSALDGSYAVTNVPAGDYYVVGVLSGYALPIPIMKDLESAKDIQKVMAGIPLTHVASNSNVTANLTLIHGAVISGRTLFDDGAPAENLTARLTQTEGFDPEQVAYAVLHYANQAAFYAQTDDRGYYRFAGVRPGKYRVTVEVPAESGTRAHGKWDPKSQQQIQLLTLYAPGKFHQSEAQIIEVQGGENIPDTDVKVALGTTHTVSGHLLVKDDRHIPNVAFVRLRDETDKGFQMNASADPDGEFRLMYVPEGTYVLEVRAMDRSDSKDPNNPAKPDVLHRYRQNVNVIVSNHDLKVDDVLLEAQKAME